MQDLARLQQQQQQPAAVPTGAHLHVDRLSYQPPGAPSPLLCDVTLTLPPNQLGLVFGRSGAGKSTLLQLVGGLAQQSGGHVSLTGPPPPLAQASGGGVASSSSTSSSSGSSCWASAEARMGAAGLVFQFPERHFIGATLAAELTLGWPPAAAGASFEAMAARQALATRTHEVLEAVGLAGVALDAPLASLSDGYKRRVALAVQLVRRPALLLLDEPLAGLDWRTRRDLVALLAALKRRCTVLVVSHDLRELAPLVDAAWEMRPGGELAPAPLDRLPKLI